MHSFGQIIHYYHFGKHTYRSRYLFIWTRLNCNMNRSLRLFINPIPSPYFSSHSPISFSSLPSLLSNQDPQQPLRGAALAAAVAKERKRRKEVQVVRQREAHSMLSLPGELALFTSARWELKWRQSPFLYYLLIFSIPSTLCLLPRQQKGGICRAISEQSSSSSGDSDLGGEQLLWAMLLCSLQTRCSLWLNRNHPGRWLIIQNPAPHSRRFWFCRTGMQPKTGFFVVVL